MMRCDVSLASFPHLLKLRRGNVEKLRRRACWPDKQLCSAAATEVSVPQTTCVLWQWKESKLRRGLVAGLSAVRSLECFALSATLALHCVLCTYNCRNFHKAAALQAVGSDNCSAKFFRKAFSLPCPPKWKNMPNLSRKVCTGKLVTSTVPASLLLFLLSDG